MAIPTPLIREEERSSIVESSSRIGCKGSISIRLRRRIDVAELATERLSQSDTSKDDDAVSIVPVHVEAALSSRSQANQIYLYSSVFVTHEGRDGGALQ